MRFVLTIILISVLIFSACVTGKKERHAPPEITMPEAFSDSTGVEFIKSAWWEMFDDEELDGLINHAIKHNFALIARQARIEQEEAKLAKENSALFPGFNFSLGGQRKNTRVKTHTNTSAVSDGSHSWDASLTGAYDADIWSENKALKKSQYLQLEAARQDYEYSVNDVISQVAQTWVDIISSRNEKKILDNQIKINKVLFRLQKLRYSNGQANALEVSQQREALAGASSQVPLLERQERILLNKLAFLCGRISAQGIKLTDRELPKTLPLPDTGIPSDLLTKRSDIKAARLRLSSSEWEIDAAKADLLPSFSLTAQALFSSGQLELLFQNWVASLTAAIAGPLFDGGLRRSEIERVKAVAKEMLNSYVKTVATAIREVEDALVNINRQEEYLGLLEDELALARLTLKDAMLQYQNGQSSYLAYLTTWTSIERLERQLVSEKAAYIKYRIDLFKVLGWYSGETDKYGKTAMNKKAENN